MRHPARGITLIELLITLAIVGVLTGLAMPAWEQATLKVRRGEAINVLQRVAAQQSVFFMHQQRYAGNTELSPPPPAGLGINPQAHYLVENRLTAEGFRATATVLATGAQRLDEHCWMFSIDAAGQKSATTRSGVLSTKECWRS